MSPNVSAPQPALTRKQRKAATRAALRDAARRCFETRGLAATGVADITEAAGVAHGTFYVHFKSKEALLDELLDELNQQTAERLRPLLTLGGEQPLEARVRNAAGAFLDHWRSRSAFVRCYAEGALGSLDLGKLRDGINPPMRALVREALAAVAPAQADGAHLTLLASALLAMWLRIGLQYVFGEQVSRQQAVEVLVGATVGAATGVLSALPTRGERERRGS